jgi:hypothetical protein
VTVGTKQEGAGFTKSFEVNLVADPVTGTREIETVFGGKGLEKEMVVGILKTGLEGIVIDVTDREFGPDPGNVQGLKLEVSQGPGSVLSQGLIDPESNLLTRDHLSGDEMLANYFFG